MTPEELLEAGVDKLYERQQRICQALEEHPARILKMRNVLSVGVGVHFRKGRPTATIGPVVVVSRKVPVRKLPSAHRIPRSLKVGGKKLRIDVLDVGKPRKLCLVGVPDTQHVPQVAVPPGVAMCAVDANGQIPVGRSGTSGAIIMKDVNPPQPVRYILTCKHIIGQQFDWAHPWVNTPLRGTWVASGTFCDCSLSEVQNYQTAMHCLGVLLPPIKPLPGMKVMKSGARTGLTGSVVTFVSLGAFFVLIDNTPTTPRPGAPVGTMFCQPGDSGSVTMLGTPFNPLDPLADTSDLGKPINSLIQAIVATLSNPGVTADLLQRTFRGRAVSLIHAISTGAFSTLTATPLYEHTEWCHSHGMTVVLQDLSRVAGVPLVIAQN
jgi:hypothetical protein